jgi:dipeptidyl-peptidase-4
VTELTLDLVARFPRPATVIPGKPAFSPDGRLLTYLFARDGGLARDLWALDVASGERRLFFTPPGEGVTDDNVSRDEQLRRERQRLRETGVTHYAWSDEGATLLVPLRGELFVQRDGAALSIAREAIDPHLSPDGTKVAFVRAGDLHVVDVATAKETRLTHDAAPGITNGLAEYIAQEEMARSSGLWWSRDSKRIAFAKVDERHIPLYPIPHLGRDVFELEEHRYPFAGAANAKVSLHVVSVDGGKAEPVPFPGEYLARVAWHPDGRLFVQSQDRRQRTLVVSSGGAVLWTESSDSYVNLHHDLRFVRESGEILWASERTGFKHLYLLSPDGKLLRPVTSGDWPVDSVVGFDSKSRRVAFTAAKNPVEMHVFVASLDGGQAEQLTKEPGLHSALFGPDFRNWVDIHESLSTPPSVTLRGSKSVVIHPPAAVDVDLARPELRSFRNRDGVELHAMLTKPAKLPAPLIVYVYGGPHVQLVQDSWAATVDLRAQFLAKQGLLVMRVDNRGSSRRGHAFESALYRRMGTIEVDDQADAVRWAMSQGLVDRDRVGIYGWSYGGYMTLMCLAKAPDLFKVGVAGAPVTSWDGYDTHYTERYMDTPQENPDGYRDGSVMTHASKMTGRLMLVHGMIDENVHFRHTARLLDAMAKAGKPVDLLLYPGERHMPRSEKDRRSMESRIVDYFKTWL